MVYWCTHSPFLASVVGVGGESWAMWCGGDASTSGGAREGPVPGYRDHVVMWSCDLVFLC